MISATLHPKQRGEEPPGQCRADVIWYDQVQRRSKPAPACLLFAGVHTHNAGWSPIPLAVGASPLTACGGEVERREGWGVPPSLEPEVLSSDLLEVSRC